MQSTLQKEFVSWLKQNAFKRDVSGLIRKQHRGKSLEEILNIEFENIEDTEDEKEVWRSNYSQVKFWYQLEYFFERSYDDLSESWFMGEIVTYIGNGEDKDLVWGIKGETHLNLKLREWAERFDDGEITLVDVSDEIPQKYGGDLEGEGRYKRKDGEWVKFRYDSERREIIEQDQSQNDLNQFIGKLFDEKKEKPKSKSVNSSHLRKEEVEKDLLQYWNLERSNKGEWIAPVIYSIGFSLILSLIISLVIYFSNSDLEKTSIQREVKNSYADNSYNSDDDKILQSIRQKQAQEAFERSRSLIPTTKEVLLENINEIEENIGHLPSDYRKYMSLQMDARRKLVDPSFKNNKMNIELANMANNAFLLEPSEKNVLLKKISEKLEMSQDLYDYTEQLNLLIKSKVKEQDLEIAEKDIIKLDATLTFQREFNRVERNFYISLKELLLFLLKTPHDFDGQQFLFDTDSAVRNFNTLSGRHESMQDAYLNFDYRLIKRN